MLGSRQSVHTFPPSSVPFCHADTNLLYVYNMSNGNEEELFYNLHCIVYMSVNRATCI